MYTLAMTARVLHQKFGVEVAFEHGHSIDERGNWDKAWRNYEDRLGDVDGTAIWSRISPSCGYLPFSTSEANRCPYGAANGDFFLRYSRCCVKL